MKAAKTRPAAGKTPEIRRLHEKLKEARETLFAIGRGKIDAVVVPGRRKPQVFTLDGAEHIYRLLIESMNEGALTLTAAGMILYANQVFATMVGKRLDRITGSSFFDLMAAEDRQTLMSVFRKRMQAGSKHLVHLKVKADSTLPVQISIRSLVKNGKRGDIITMVVTDMSEYLKKEIQLRALAYRIVTVQEEERKRVSQELHDGINQMLCAILFHAQAIRGNRTLPLGPEKRRARILCGLVSETIEEVSRISHHLRPSVLDHLGLVASIRDACREFKNRTRVEISVRCDDLKTRIPAEIELAYYRILQESLRNIEKYAGATKVDVRLTKTEQWVLLSIQDDGVGFDSATLAGGMGKLTGLGLPGMSERMKNLGGKLSVVSGANRGTTIMARIRI